MLVRGLLIGAVLSLALLTGGCGQTLQTPSLSEVISLPGGTLSSEQQKKAIQEMSEKKTSQESEVEKQISKSR